MTAFSNSPRLIKGALIGISPLNPTRNAVIFQYNPDTLTRRLEPRAASAGGDRSETLRLTGPPKETITLSIEIDATDQIKQANPQTVATGIHPTLAALETMLYPPSPLVIANTILSMVGTIEILPLEGPLILFVWGAQRVLPVRIDSFSVTEEAYDTFLNPIRAKVELSLTVLSYQDLGVLHPGHSLFMAHQMTKEIMAATNIANSA